MVGNLGALRQRSVVRLLAWSSIAQAGYLLVPVAAGAVVGLGGLDGLVAAASVAYLAVYGAMNLGAFAVVAAAAGPGRRASGLRLEDLRGLARTRPLLGLPLVFFLACLAGLPPGLVGLVAKVRVFEPPVRGGTPWLALLAVVAALATVVGLAYYLRFAAIVLAAPAPVPAAAEPDRPRGHGGRRWRPAPAGRSA